MNLTYCEHNGDGPLSSRGSGQGRGQRMVGGEDSRAILGPQTLDEVSGTRHVGGSSHLKPSGTPAVQGQRILLHLHRPLSGQRVQDTWEEHSQLSREENMGRGAHYQLAGLKSHTLPSRGVWSPLLLLARGESRLPFTVCWPGVGGAFLFSSWKFSALLCLPFPPPWV